MFLNWKFQSSNGKPATETLPNGKRAEDSPTCDRGIADGNSNQPDSDFGKITLE